MAAVDIGDVVGFGVVVERVRERVALRVVRNARLLVFGVVVPDFEVVVKVDMVLCKGMALEAITVINGELFF